MKEFFLSPLLLFLFFRVTFSTFSQLGYPCQRNIIICVTAKSQLSKGEKKQAIYNLFAAYLHTVPLEELIDNIERSRRDAQLRYMVIYGASCSSCLSRAKRLDGSHLRTFALELKEQLAQTLTGFVTSILTQPRGRLNTEEATEPALRQIVEVLEQVMCKHDAEKLAISVLEIYKE